MAAFAACLLVGILIGMAGVLVVAWLSAPR
jgi:hypothetical protein